jgi:hypothetical protein
MRRLVVAALLLLASQRMEAGTMLRRVVAAGGGVSSENNYRDQVMLLSPTMYWRLGESSGVTAEEENNNYDGTYTNGPTLGSASLVPNTVNTAVTFARASSQYITAKAVNPGTAFTAIAWINTTYSSEIQCMVSMLEIGGNLNGVIWQINTGTGRIAVGLCANDASCDTLNGTFDLTGGVNYMVALTYNNGTASIYRDGVQTGSWAGVDVPAGGADPVSTLVGKDHLALNRYFDGVLDDVTIWVGTDIGATEIQNLWQAAQK